MNKMFSLKDCRAEPVSAIGGKAAALAVIDQSGVLLPKTYCLSTELYTRFLDGGGLREKIQLELNRKKFGEMRWEEIWDTSLRIRNLFLSTGFPVDLKDELHHCVEQELAGCFLAIRSSAPEEDQASTSFAGLHDSYLGIRDFDEILIHVKKVWASLWSDRALLYRQELGLSVRDSAMAVILQELVEGDSSGVAFSSDPIDGNRIVIEAVYGLNQGLVDGEISPDRYFVDRSTCAVIEHVSPDERTHRMTMGRAGVRKLENDREQYENPPLVTAQLQELAETVLQLENFLGYPVDVEWTFTGEKLCILQARPVSTGAGVKSNDQRSWYLSLHRSFSNLLALRETIEDHMLPAMEQDAAAMAAVNLQNLDNSALAMELQHRLDRSSHWSKKYWDDCIPFAHGIRLFGEVYNDTVVPDDPYEFVRLLSGAPMLSTERNQLIYSLSKKIRDNPDLAKRLVKEGYSAISDSSVKNLFEELEERFGNFFSGLTGKRQSREDKIIQVVLQYGHLEGEVTGQSAKDSSELERVFLEKLSGSSSEFDGHELLELARASYRLRDDDNIYMGKIEQQLELCMQEGRSRITEYDDSALALAMPDELIHLLHGESIILAGRASGESAKKRLEMQEEKARQLVGQPASGGFAKGVARVILDKSEMADFHKGEVLVVDSIDPNMTFLAPLAAAIIERRGGMLIHGAIIAREYGIPCVTGVSDVTELVVTGDTLSVDGYLGVVVVDRD